MIMLYKLILNLSVRWEQVKMDEEKAIKIDLRVFSILFIGVVVVLTIVVIFDIKYGLVDNYSEKLFNILFN